MDKIKLNELLSMDDSIVSMQDLVLIDRLSVKYPYCSIFKVCGAKFASIVGSFNKQTWLQNAGIYFGQRIFKKHHYFGG